MALSRNVWPFTLLYILAAVGYGTSDTVHNSYLADAYPTQARARIFAYHNVSDPISQTVGIFIVGLIAAATGDWRWALLLAAVRASPWRIALLFIREPAKGANESSHILQAAGHGHRQPTGVRAQGAAGPGGETAAADPLALLRAGRRRHPRVRRVRASRCSARCTSSASGTSAPASAATSTC